MLCRTDFTHLSASTHHFTQHNEDLLCRNPCCVKCCVISILPIYFLSFCVNWCVESNFLHTFQSAKGKSTILKINCSKPKSPNFNLLFFFITAVLMVDMVPQKFSSKSFPRRNKKINEFSTTSGRKKSHFKAAC